MKQFTVEGLYISKPAVRKARRSGKIPTGSVEPFAKTIWANSPEEAIRLATEELKGGEWVEGPRITPLSEEQRMRAMGAPELPGLGTPPDKRKRRG
jgi:hypothetical protein